MPAPRTPPTPRTRAPSSVSPEPPPSKQLAKHDINVYALPGVARTELSDANLQVRAEQAGVSIEIMEKRRDEAIPLGRPCEPSDIAAMAVFLASPGARNITGQSYNVDGGIIPE